MEQSEIDQFTQSFADAIRQKVPYTSPWIWEAFRSVPRHLFIEQYYEYTEGHFTLVAVNRDSPSPEFLKLVYGDNGLMIRNIPNHSAASQPALVANMLHHLDIRKGLKVLEIGTGSGWNAALITVGVGKSELVFSVDLQEDLVDEARRHLLNAGLRSVNLLTTDGGHGWPQCAPFDRIIATVGCPEIPPAWLDQLAQGGVLLVPLKTSPIGDPLLRLRKDQNGLTGRFIGYSGFMTLQGCFTSAVEDPLFRPWSPDIDALLSADPTIVHLQERLDFNALFFAYLNGTRLRALIDHNLKSDPHVGFYDSQLGAIYQADPANPSLRIYGNPEQAEFWRNLVDKWVELGKPKFTDYEVDLACIDRGTTCEQTWKVQRTHNSYWFRLRPLTSNTS